MLVSLDAYCTHIDSLVSIANCTHKDINLSTMIKMHGKVYLLNQNRFVSKQVLF